MSDRISDVMRGDRFVWEGVRIEVTRIAKDKSWADIRCRAYNGNTWTKRQKLPMPKGTVRITRPAEAV